METPTRPFAGVEPSGDVEVARWLVDRLHPLGRDVGAVVPTGFAAYVRLDHPGDEDEGDDEPWVGGLRTGDAEALAAVLAGFTSTPDDCRFCLWDGYGDVTGAVAVFVAEHHPDATGAEAVERVEQAQRRAEQELDRAKRAVADVVGQCGRVEAPDREYLLFRGPVAAVTAASAAGAGISPSVDVLDGPNLWWPADRAWVVASEIDLAWTYVAGPRGARRHPARRLPLRRQPHRPRRPDHQALTHAIVPAGLVDVRRCRTSPLRRAASPEPTSASTRTRWSRPRSA